jgi:hypothetical protein
VLAVQPRRLADANEELLAREGKQAGGRTSTREREKNKKSARRVSEANGALFGADESTESTSQMDLPVRRPPPFQGLNVPGSRWYWVRLQGKPGACVHLRARRIRFKKSVRGGGWGVSRSRGETDRDEERSAGRRRELLFRRTVGHAERSWGARGGRATGAERERCVRILPRTRFARWETSSRGQPRRQGRRQGASPTSTRIPPRHGPPKETKTHLDRRGRCQSSRPRTWPRRCSCRRSRSCW